MLDALLKVPQVILYLLGLACVLLGILGRLEARWASITASPVQRGLLVATGAVAIALGLLPHFTGLLPHDSGERSTLVIVPASTLWVDTGIEVEPGQAITILATGAVHLAVHRLVEAAQEDTKPRFGWLGPVGLQPEEGCVDRKRRLLKVKPESGYGALLAYLRPSGEIDPSWALPRPPGIGFVGASSTLTYSDERNRKGRLFLTVNDGVLSDNGQSRAAYVVDDQKCLDETYGVGKKTVQELEQQWEQVKATDNWAIWYDDNIGAYLVRITRGGS